MNRERRAKSDLGRPAFMRFPFDRRTVSGLPCTRMPGTGNVSLTPALILANRRLHAAWAVCAALVLASFAVQFAVAMPMGQKHESRHDIDQLEDEWRDAMLAANTKVMDSLLAPDYMGITASGTLQSRDETLQSLSSGRLHFTLLDVSDRKVRFYGITAVVTSLANIQATTPDGKVIGSYRYTHVYVRDAQGDWKIVSFEASRVREPGPHKRNELH
jgi:ketosteroid isomerase-like protein